MLQNLALNIAEKGFPISVYNRSYEKTEAAEARAKKTGACASLSKVKASPHRASRCCGHHHAYKRDNEYIVVSI